MSLRVRIESVMAWASLDSAESYCFLVIDLLLTITPRASPLYTTVCREFLVPGSTLIVIPRFSSDTLEYVSLGHAVNQPVHHAKR